MSELAQINRAILKHNGFVEHQVKRAREKPDARKAADTWPCNAVSG